MQTTNTDELNKPLLEINKKQPLFRVICYVQLYWINLNLVDNNVTLVYLYKRYKAEELIWLDALIISFIAGGYRL